MDNDGGAFIIGRDDVILVTGASGFIGSRVVECLLRRGFRNIRCFTRTATDAGRLTSMAGNCVSAHRGNLLSFEDCVRATKDAKVIIHLAAGRGEKSFPDAFMNSVVTTRNLLEASVQNKYLRRFVNISSFAVYSNQEKKHGRLLDESCPVEPSPERRGEAYCYAKVKQDEMVTEYGGQLGLPYVIVRPGYVYGPGKRAVTGRVGIDTFGVFLHMGGSNTIPFTYVDNCADAIVLASLREGVDGEVFNVIDDDLPTSRQFLRLYKRNVRPFKSLYVPHGVSYLLCRLWQWYSEWSNGQLPPVFNCSRWHANWKSTRYSNDKAKKMLGWRVGIPTSEGLRRYFEGCREGCQNA